jgi:hypothetical protein
VRHEISRAGEKEVGRIEPRVIRHAGDDANVKGLSKLTVGIVRGSRSLVNRSRRAALADPIRIPMPAWLSEMNG